MKTRIIFGLAVCGCMCMAATAKADESKVLQCSANMSGMAHDLKLTISGGEVVSFVYGSVDPKTARDCRVSASSVPSEKKKEDGSTWTKQADGSALVDLYDDNWATDDKKKVATVTIRASGKSYRLTAAEIGDAPFCAPGAYLAPTVVLTQGKRRCALEDGDTSKGR